MQKRWGSLQVHKRVCSRRNAGLTPFSPSVMSNEGFAKLKNDQGVPAICIDVKEFKCVGVSPPHDHPHIYLGMGMADRILCPYCGTVFRYDPRSGLS